MSRSLNSDEGRFRLTTFGALRGRLRRHNISLNGWAVADLKMIVPTLKTRRLHAKARARRRAEIRAEATFALGRHDRWRITADVGGPLIRSPWSRYIDGARTTRGVLAWSYQTLAWTPLGMALAPWGVDPEAV